MLQAILVSIVAFLAAIDEYTFGAVSYTHLDVYKRQAGIPGMAPSLGVGSECV